ncbi:hypothetical protein ILYODFUR_021410 [Ilyodon furcidens]|uniref:Uncharacterized protein n=1 Tax=Ilyodon furcidens TaxID=33524 RepID=A0ABV0V7T5_9TELE
MVFVKNKPGTCFGVCKVLQYINSPNNDSDRKQQGFKLAFFPLFEEDISLPAVTMETKLYKKFLLTHMEGLTQSRNIQVKVVQMPCSAAFLQKKKPFTET